MEVWGDFWGKGKIMNWEWGGEQVFWEGERLRVSSWKGGVVGMGWEWDG